MTTGVLCPTPIIQIWDNNQQFAAGGYITTTVGGISTAVYQDSGLTIPLPQPVPLNSRGEVSNSSGQSCQLFLTPNVVYTFTFFDANGNQFNQASYVDGIQVNQASIGLSLWPQTSAELSANITPTFYFYPEGDIRRYGALAAVGDNSGAINSALTVSSFGGSAAYLAPGTWPIQNPCVAPPGSSMYGAGATNSIILAANGVDGLQLTTGDTSYGGRTFRDFQILGALSGIAANNAHGVYAVASGFLLNILFQNVAVVNFNWGFYLTNLEDSTIFACLVQNCWNGIYFNNQSVNVWLLDNTVNFVSPAGTPMVGTGNSTGISVQGAPEVEGLHIQGGTIYNYAYNITFGLIFECQILGVDISLAKIAAIQFTSELGNLNISDCWIQLSGTSGTLFGINITAITPSVNSKVTITNNYIKTDVSVANSTGIYIGDRNDGIVVHNNQIYNFDIGIGGGDGVTFNTGTDSNGMSIKNNTINATTSAILFNTFSQEAEIGPNYIVAGTPLTLTGAPPASLVYKQPNVPMSGTVTFVSATTVGVTFTNAMPYAGYRVTLSGNAAGYCSVSSKATTGFVITCSASNSNSVDWYIS